MSARAIAVIGAALLLAGCSRSPDAGQDEQQPRRSALGADFALTSQSITLPTDETEKWPPGPGAEQIETNCRACHSPSMVLTQPPLSHDEWVKVIDKMRTTYKAVINEQDIPMILAYLDNFSAKQLATMPASTPAASASPAAPGSGPGSGQ